MSKIYFFGVLEKYETTVAGGVIRSDVNVDSSILDFFNIVEFVVLASIIKTFIFFVFDEEARKKNFEA
jgi:hypothetical protein